MRACLAFTAVLLLTLGCGDRGEEPALEAEPSAVAPGAAGPSDPQIRAIVDSEELLLTLRPELARLEASALNLRLPDHRSEALFAPEVVHNDVVAAGAARPVADSASASGSATQSPMGSVRQSPMGSVRDWSIDPAERRGSPADLDLWRPLLDDVAWFDRATFDFHGGVFPDGARDVWDATLGFSALARTVDGGWRSVEARIETRWRKTGAGRGPRGRRARSWKIERFALAELRSIESDRRLFAEVLDAALPDATSYSRARDSAHEQLLLDWVREGEGWRPPMSRFRVKPTDWQPGLSVVDVDRDGHDDLYVMDRWGRNMLLRNRGDGTFVDVAAARGLDQEDHNCCGVFADFDNDGDPDLFLGRTVERSLYLVNEDGLFVDRSDRVASPLPALITSVSAVDYDGDGLLDVYFSTYAAELMDVLAGEQREGLLEPGPPLREFLTKREAIGLARRMQTSHRYLDRTGPPNVLFRNVGDGRFERAPDTGQLAVWRNTFQSTWSDFDGDGDADVYVANDFAPNNLLRNDGDAGFTDVTAESGTADIGFGMGASWGDYDNDGRPDLYVTNMYSKAGRRITGAVEGLDPRLANMSRGNSLFRNEGERFAKVSGLEAPALQVEKAGWSWGGQFVDVDNDGYLDLYASSGMYTAPSQVRVRGADL